MAEVLEQKILDLLASREELVNRLNNLESMKDETNPRVYKRIREDYSAKLQDVLEKVNEQRDSLESKARELTEEIREKEELYTNQSDRVDELQIRAKLGEFNQDNEEFKNELNAAESERDVTFNVLEQLKKELDDLKGVLSDVDHATSAGVPGGDEDVLEEVEEEELDIAEAEMVDDDSVEEIEELDMELEDLSEEPDADENKCPVCGHVNPPHLVVCEKCGAELEDLSQDIDDEFDFDDMDVDI